jgi:hypothetical protein
MGRRIRDLRSLAGRYFREFRVEPTRGAHFRILVEGPLGKAIIVACNTASDQRSDKNLEADLKRAARSLGVV